MKDLPFMCLLVVGARYCYCWYWKQNL